jgi:hypothetical protein
LNNLEAENKELKGKLESPAKKWKERYDWPLHYSYKLWGGCPVLDYVTIKKDPTRGLVFKNQYGEYTENQILKLTVLWAKWPEEVEALIYDFNNSHERSEKMPAKVETDWVSPLSFTFDTVEFWEFTVKTKVIN